MATEFEPTASRTFGEGLRPALRILLVAHLDRLSTRLDRSQYYRYAALARQPGVTLFGPGLWGYRRGMSVDEAVDVACDGEYPDVILHGFDFKESGVPLLTGLPKSTALTVLELQDSWAVPDEQADFINRQQFDLGLLIVGHHLPYYAQNCPHTRFVWTPHAINTTLFHDYGLPKEYDVLLYGNITEHTYPFRSRLARLLTQSELKFHWLQHPGYYPQQRLEAPQLITGADLSREINRAWISISTSSVYRCLMMKYYEIAASGSLIAGDMPDEGREIFGNDFLELSPQQSDSEVLEALRQTLADKSALTEKTRAAQQRIFRDHSTDAFAARLVGQLGEFVHSRRTTVTSPATHGELHAHR